MKGPGPKGPAAPAAGKKLTAEQKRQVRSLVDDSGYTRAEAIAWVTTFGGAS